MLGEGKKVVETTKAEIQKVQDHAAAQIEATRREADAKIAALIDSTKAELQKVQDRATAQFETTRREADAKVASLKEQASNVRTQKKQ